MDTTLSEASAAQVIEQLLSQINRLEAGLLEERNWGEKQKHIYAGEVVRGSTWIAGETAKRRQPD